jgi:hypothetical protein
MAQRGAFDITLPQSISDGVEILLWRVLGWCWLLILILNGWGVTP